MQKRLLVAGMLCCCIAAARGSNQSRPAISPGAKWAKATPEQLGWARAKLDEAQKLFDNLPPASLFVVDHGNVVVEWGDCAMKIKISSMRKSILSAFYDGRAGMERPS
jgi:hypothetical protein